MIEIRYLIASLAVMGTVMSAGSAYARDGLEVSLTKSLWTCGASLLPCRGRNEIPTTTLPYWRGNTPAQPIRVTYTPAFPRANR
jgi:hypothetical protein